MPGAQMGKLWQVDEVFRERERRWEDFTVADLTSCQRQMDLWPANLSYLLDLSQKGSWTLTEGC